MVIGSELTREYVLDHIIYRLVGMEIYKDMYKERPSIAYTDHAAVFDMVIPDSAGKDYIASAPVNYQFMDHFLLTFDEVREAADRNTPRLFPPVITRFPMMSDGAMMHDSIMVNDLFVFTNEKFVNGAAVIYYDGILKNWSERSDSDLVIIPSSVHEVLITPLKEDTNLSALKKIVKEVNEEAVDMKDRLSNTVFVYHRESESIVVLA